MIRNILIVILLNSTLFLAVHAWRIQASTLIAVHEKYIMLPKDKWEMSMFDVRDGHATEFHLVDSFINGYDHLVRRTCTDVPVKK